MYANHKLIRVEQRKQKWLERDLNQLNQHSTNWAIKPYIGGLPILFGGVNPKLFQP